MPGKRKTDWSKKNLTGEYHWTQCMDWKLHKYGTIFDIPVEVLEEAGWYQIEMGVQVTLPIQRLQIDYNYGKRGGQDYSTYQLLTIDWDYLLERQARLYASLSWGNEEIKQFHRTQETWLEERTKVLKEQELFATAKELAEKMGSTSEQVLALLKAQQAEEVIPEEPNETEQTENIAVLEKLGNEFFLYSEKLGGRYKIKDKKSITEAEATGSNPEQFTGLHYAFEYSEDNPPKSRNAKGWVTKLERIDNKGL